MFQRYLVFFALALSLLLNIGAAETDPVELVKVTENLWIHTTYMQYNGYPTPSNGLVAVTDRGLILVDTPWTESQTRKLMDIASEKFGQPFVEAVITHAHQDRIGGIRILLDAKIPVKSTTLTAELAEKQGYLRPDPVLTGNDQWSVGGTPIETFYPGGGHTRDNTVVWFPNEKLLLGGCLVKSMASKNIGNTADADLKAWPDSLKKLLERYPDAKFIIPGHGEWGGPELIRHTLDLLGK